MLAPVGASTRLYVSVFAGMSKSVAVAVNVSSVSSSIVLSPIAASTGAVLTSLTVTVISSSSLREPSLATTLSVKLPGPCASVGVHVNTPVVALMLAPVGASTRLYVSVFAGRSASVADAVNVNSLPSFTALSLIVASTGATFTSFTVTVISSSSVNTPSLT